MQGGRLSQAAGPSRLVSVSFLQFYKSSQLHYIFVNQAYGVDVESNNEFE